MATVTSVTLAPLNPSPTDPSKLHVNISYAILFEAAEVGKAHRIAVQLLGEDKPGDEEVPGPFSKPQILYTFGFGLNAFKSVTPPVGTFTDTVTADVAHDKLNEDPGSTFKEVVPGTVIKIPYPDEIYARVTVSRVSEGISTTQKLL